MSSSIEPSLHSATTEHRGVLVWQWAKAVTALSSASVGGGLTEPHWVTNVGVGLDYDRTDLGDHASEVAAELSLEGRGIALFTAADVSRVSRDTCGDVSVDATAGVSKPTWAADPSDGYSAWSPGTINIVVQLPVGLSHGAAVNAVITATEAKTQALIEAGVPGTGTASDAMVIVWPTEAAAEPFAGPRSRWGGRVAQATHAAVLAGIGSTG